MILSSHIVSDIEAAATSIAVMNKGQLLAHALPEEMLRSVQGKVWEWTIPSAELHEAASKYVVSGTTRTSDGVRIRVVADDSPDGGARPLTPTLEDAYLHMLSSRSLEAN